VEPETRTYVPYIRWYICSCKAKGVIRWVTLHVPKHTLVSVMTLKEKKIAIS